MFISLNLLGSMVLDITSNRLDAIFLRETQPLQTNDSFTIIKTNYAPIASTVDLSVAADSSTPLALHASDINRNPLSFATTALPTNGLVSAFDPATGTLTYTPARGSTNTDRFAFVATDGRLASAPATVTVHVSPPVDSNHNGLPDEWEALYGISDPDGDADGDGATNLEEYRAGTNPTNALSWLRITKINQGASGYQIVWSSVGGVRYRVLFSDADSQGSFNGVFTPIVRTVIEEMDPNEAGSPGTLSFTDDFLLTGGPPGYGSRFYRLQVVN
jgi:hypothetical protein